MENVLFPYFKSHLSCKAETKFCSLLQSLPWLHGSQSSHLQIYRVLLIGRIHLASVTYCLHWKLSVCMCTFSPNSDIPSLEIGQNLIFLLKISSFHFVVDLKITRPVLQSRTPGGLWNGHFLGLPYTPTTTYALCIVSVRYSLTWIKVENYHDLNCHGFISIIY